MRRALLLALAALAGCGGGGSDGSPSDEEVIRGWNSAVNDGDYEAAADRFAEGAIIEQIREVRLRTRAQAIAFNRSLPCRADVTDIDAEEDGGSLATFDLRTGRTGECSDGGTARVRFVIEDGLIREWRQLPEAPLPSGSQSA